MKERHRPPVRGKGKSLFAQWAKQVVHGKKMRATNGKDDEPMAAWQSGYTMVPLSTEPPEVNEFADEQAGYVTYTVHWSTSSLVWTLGGDVVQAPPKPERERRKQVGAVVAYRGWSLTNTLVDPILKSVNQNTRWESPVLHADGPPRDDQPEGGQKGHGVYAFTTPKELFKQYSHMQVWGEVALHGKVVVHENGYRAEHAMIRTLILSPATWVKWGDELAARLQARYGCEVTSDYRELFRRHDGGPR